VLASVQIGDSGPVLRISRIDATLNQDHVLVAALRGTPALPASTWHRLLVEALKACTARSPWQEGRAA